MLRLLSAGLIAATLAAAACDGAGSHNNPDEARTTTGDDSLTAGTAVPNSLPPAGTVNPGAPSGPGTYPDSASAGAVGQPTSPASGTGPVQPPTQTEKEGDDSPREP